MTNDAVPLTTESQDISAAVERYIAAVESRRREQSRPWLNGGHEWKQAHRRALVAGNFDDPCDHGVSIPHCTNAYCIATYCDIVRAHHE